MDTNANLKDSIRSEDEIDIKKLFQILWNGKIFIAVSTVLFSIFSITYSTGLPNIYQSQALLSSAEEARRGGSSNSIGGLANIAGLNISSGGSKTSLAIEKIKTLSFFEENILPNIFLPDLMAMKSWDPVTNTISYNEDKYDKQNGSWVSRPSSQTSYNMFKGIMSVNESRDKNIITIKIKHQSPHIAKSWTELVVNQINQHFRDIDKQEAEMSLDYLNNQMTQTSYSEIKQVISQLIKERMQKLTLIEVNEFYIFSYLDPPKVMESKIEPDRNALLILGGVIGLMLGIIIVLTRNFFGYKEIK